MSFTYVPGATDRDQVRLLVHDTDEDNPLFSDEEMDAFLTLEGQNVYRAAADALDAVAGNQVLILKVTKLLDLSVDGAKVAEALHRQAVSLRAQANEVAAGNGEEAFAIAEQIYTPAGYRRQIWNGRLRGAV